MQHRPHARLEREKNFKSQPVQNKMQIILCTCQDNNAHEENVRIAQTERKSCDNQKAFSEKPFMRMFLNALFKRKPCG